MKDNNTQAQVILSTFHDRGWVDLDEILELLAKKTPITKSNSTETTEKPSSSQDVLQRKIAALMDLADLTDAQREQLITRCKSVEQLQQLYNEWEEKISAILGVDCGKSEDIHQEVLREDYSKYQSGKKEKMFLIKRFQSVTS